MTAEEKAIAAKYFYDAVAGGSSEEVADLLRKGAQQFLEVKHGYYKETPLLVATWNKRRDVISILLQHKVNVNAENHAGRTSLMNAAINDDTDTMTMLISHGANIHATDRCGLSALHFASKASVDGEAVKLLIDAGADVNLKCAASVYTWFFQSIDRDLQTHLFTPLHFAALACNANTVTLLMKNYANGRAKDGKGRTPLKLLLFHTQHIVSAYKDNYFKTRERLKRPNAEYPPAERQVVNPEPTPEPEIAEKEELDLKDIRKGLIQVRNDLVKDYSAASEGFKDGKTDEKTLREVARSFEEQAKTRVVEATDYINAAVDILKDTEISSSRDVYDDYTYHRVFTFIAKEIGAKKEQWHGLAKTLLKSVKGVSVEKVIKAVWSHSSTEVEAAHEVLVKWKVYTEDKPDAMTRLKTCLWEMGLGKPFLINVNIIINEKWRKEEEEKQGKKNKIKGKVKENKSAESVKKGKTLETGSKIKTPRKLIKSSAADKLTRLK